MRLRDVASVQEVIEEAVRDTLAQPNSAQRSRALGYLAGIALKALEVGELEARLAALEGQLGNATGHAPHAPPAPPAPGRRTA